MQDRAVGGSRFKVVCTPALRATSVKVHRMSDS